MADGLFSLRTAEGKAAICELLEQAWEKWTQMFWMASADSKRWIGQR